MASTTRARPSIGPGTPRSERSRLSTNAPTAARSNRPSTAAPPASQVAPAVLPPYEPPIHPLNLTAETQISNLTNTPVSSIQDQYKRCALALVETAGDINDVLYIREKDLKQRKQRRTRDEAPDEELDRQEHEELVELQDKTEKMTGRIEQAVRKNIDGLVLIDGLKTSLGEVRKKGEESVKAGQRRSLQSQTQSQTQHRRAGENENDDEDASPPNPTDITTTTAAVSQTQNNESTPHPLKTIFETSMTTYSDAYTSRSLTSRYGDNNTYKSYVRTVHDAKHQDDGSEAPHKSTWFPSDNSSGPAPGITVGHVDENDSEDDIAISRARISTRCPITMLELDDPLTSTKCPHSFERHGILQMIHSVRPPTRGRSGDAPPGWKQSVQCPVAGCQQSLTEEDMQTDSVLVRRIKRIQAAKERESGVSHGDMDEDGNLNGSRRRRAEEIESGDDSEDGEDIDAAMKRSQTSGRVKREKLRSTIGDDIDDDDGEE